MESIYSISELYKAYNGKTVLNIRELNIPRGKITAVIGPSGAGKSTLLHLLNCIETPSGGKIIFDGINISQRGNVDIKIRRRMIMVFQKPVVFNCSVYENIAYSLKLRGMSKKEIKKSVDEISEITGLKDKLRQSAATLSGGEAQRVVVARAIIARPEVLLFDEPTSNLDPANISIIEDLVKHANTNFKTSIVIVTHNMNQAKRLAQNVIFLLDGSIIEYGDSSRILHEPQNEQTRAFISGEMIY